MKKVGSGREGSDLRGSEGHHASEDKKGQSVWLRTIRDGGAGEEP